MADRFSSVAEVERRIAEVAMDPSIDLELTPQPAAVDPDADTVPGFIAMQATIDSLRSELVAKTAEAAKLLEENAVLLEQNAQMQVRLRAIAEITER